MQYRKFGNTGKEVSILGYGAMRMPTTDPENPGSIDEKEAAYLIHKAINEGLNYVDTAYFYHGGASEPLVGRILQNGYRQKVYVATKSPIYSIKEEGDFQTFMDEQLRRLQTDHIDFYLLHAINRHHWQDVVLRFDILHKLEEAKKAGKIGHIGFSFHDDHDTFMKVLDGYDKWEFCQVQMNYMDIENQARLDGMLEAARRGLGVVVMEPLLGGKLANPLPQIRDIFQRVNTERTPVEWALDWVWNMPEVSLLLSGMGAREQVAQNLQYAGRARAGMLSDAELKTVEAVRAAIQSITAVPCTRCGYCMPCPSGVDIPRNFTIYNEYYMYNNLEKSKGDYKWMGSEDEGKKLAKNCVACGACEARCPQQIEISRTMPKVHELLA